jgi:hypothetical protein
MLDRYQEWLGIPPGQRPPTHYALLGIAANEKDPAEIDEAAQRRTLQLRSFQAGGDDVEASRILGEIANARRVLIDPQLRRAYDDSLGGQSAMAAITGSTGPAKLSIPALAAPLTIPDPMSSPHLCKPLYAVPTDSSPTAGPKLAGDAPRLRPTWQIYLGIIFLPTAAIALMFLLRAGNSTETETAKTEAVPVKAARPGTAKPSAVADKPKNSFVPLDLEGVCNAASTDLRLGENQPLRIVLPRWGRQVYDGIPFVIPDPHGGSANNVIALDKRLMGQKDRGAPALRVPCSASAKNIYLLAAAHRGKNAVAADQPVSLIVRLNYLDGPAEDHRLRYGVELGDLSGSAGATDAKAAVTVGNYQLRYTRIAPERSRQMISFIELIHGGNAATPIIMAITLEREPR